MTLNLKTVMSWLECVCISWLFKVFTFMFFFLSSTSMRKHKPISSACSTCVIWGSLPSNPLSMIHARTLQSVKLLSHEEQLNFYHLNGCLQPIVLCKLLTAFRAVEPILMASFMFLEITWIREFQFTFRATEWFLLGHCCYLSNGSSLRMEFCFLGS